MAVLTAKDKAALSYIFELDEFKSVKKLFVYLRERATKQLISFDMSTPGADKVIAMLQGQINALDKLTDQWRKYHQDDVDRAVKEQKAKS